MILQFILFLTLWIFTRNVRTQGSKWQECNSNWRKQKLKDNSVEETIKLIGNVSFRYGWTQKLKQWTDLFSLLRFLVFWVIFVPREHIPFWCWDGRRSSSDPPPSFFSALLVAGAKALGRGMMGLDEIMCLSLSQSLRWRSMVLRWSIPGPHAYARTRVEHPSELAPSRLLGLTGEGGLS